MIQCAKSHACKICEASLPRLNYKYVGCIRHEWDHLFNHFSKINFVQVKVPTVDITLRFVLDRARFLSFPGAILVDLSNIRYFSILETRNNLIYQPNSFWNFQALRIPSPFCLQTGQFSSELIAFLYLFKCSKLQPIRIIDILTENLLSHATSLLGTIFFCLHVIESDSFANVLLPHNTGCLFSRLL